MRSVVVALFGFFFSLIGFQSPAKGNKLEDLSCEARLDRYYKPGLISSERRVPDGNISIRLIRIEDKTQVGPLNFGLSSYESKVEKKGARDSDESCMLRMNHRLATKNSAWFHGELPPSGIFRYPRMLRLEFDGTGKISRGWYADGNGKKGTRYWEFSCD